MEQTIFLFFLCLACNLCFVILVKMNELSVKRYTKSVLKYLDIERKLIQIENEYLLIKDQEGFCEFPHIEKYLCTSSYLLDNLSPNFVGWHIKMKKGDPDLASEIFFTSKQLNHLIWLQVFVLHDLYSIRHPIKRVYLFALRMALVLLLKGSIVLLGHMRNKSKKEDAIAHLENLKKAKELELKLSLQFIAKAGHS